MARIEEGESGHSFTYSVETERSVYIEYEDETEQTIYVTENATPEHIHRVLCATEDGENGGDERSQWVWLRTADGTLFLATTPQDTLYHAINGEIEI